MKMRTEELLGALPPPWDSDLLPTIQQQVARSGTKLVVLDDDPTGTQTVYDVPVLTRWDRSGLKTVLQEPGAVVYILTNSRSLPLAQAQQRNREIAANLAQASATTGRRVALVSRSDSTLRGHYPGEVTALVEALGERVDGTVLVPFFLEGGRLTIDDVHYVAEGEWLVPAAETEYARDATFGYRHSNLRQWVVEKHGGALDAADVTSISLELLRQGGPDAVRALLQGLAGQVCVVNAATYGDLEVFVAGLLQAEAAGKRFIYRTAASFVRVRGGLAPRPLLSSGELAAVGTQGGLIMAGSYIRKSSEQVEALQALAGIDSVEVDVEQLLDPARREQTVRVVAAQAGEAIRAGREALVYTSRRLITGPDAEASLAIGRSISAALVEIVEQLPERPRWLIAKGGITASDVATEGLGMKRAQVLGQAIPGIPIWRAGSDSRWPGLIYVVFPGNVGGPESIRRMVEILRGVSQVQ